MKQLVSVVIPARNEERIIENCLKSLKKQTYPHVEIIVVDNASTDGTAKIAEKYADKVIKVRTPGITFAKNAGVRESKGEYIVFTDADCIVPETWLEELVKAFISANVMSVGGSNITPEDDEDFPKAVGAVLSFLSGFGARYGFRSNDVVETFHNPGCNVAYRRKAFEEVGLFNESLLTCEDGEFDYRILLKGYKILYTHKASVYHYRRTSLKSFLRMAYRYSIGRAQAVRLYPRMGRWFHYVPTLVLLVLSTLLVLGLFRAEFRWLFLLTCMAGLLGAAALSLYMAFKTHLNPGTYFLLLWIWFIGWGVGFLQGTTLKLNKSTPESSD